MASVISHGILGIAVSTLFYKNNSKKFMTVCALSAALPDADAVGFWLGVPYAHLFGHRGITHSILFALVWGILVAFLWERKKKHTFLYRTWLGFIITLCTVSHPMLDAMTTGGLGVAFYSPFDNERIFFDKRPIVVSPIGVKQFFSSWGLRVIKSEMLWVWLPSFIFGYLNYKIGKRFLKR